MAEQPPLQFRLFFRDSPTMFAGWRTYDEERRWDRHYIIGSNLSLRIERGERVELTRWGMVGRFAVASTVLSSAFPLDWMALSCITRSLPREFRMADIDGRSAQRFVDSLALPGLVQASVLKHERYMRDGAVMGTASRVEIPDWNARGITVNLSCQHANSLKLTLEALELDRYQHLAFDTWMQRAYDAAFPAPAEDDDEPFELDQSDPTPEQSGAQPQMEEKEAA